MMRESLIGKKAFVSASGKPYECIIRSEPCFIKHYGDFAVVIEVLSEDQPGRLGWELVTNIRVVSGAL